MIMPDREIRWMCKQQRPMIEPFIEKESYHGISRGLSSYGYDATLADEFIKMEKPQYANPYVLDISQTIPDGMQSFKRGAGGIMIEPGEMVLGKTNEYFRIPNNVVGMVCDKSSLARRGIFVQNTILEPGWNGCITLEITNNSYYHWFLRDGVGICQILFQTCLPCENPYPTTGKYQEQVTVVPAR